MKSPGVPTAELPSATDWIARLRLGEISARELVDLYLERIRSVNPSLNAVVALDEERAREQAGQADEDRARGSQAPLLGLPVTIKDSLEVAGMVSTGGSLARRGHVPSRDATAVARLKDAGAIVLGKTNAPEYSCSYETDNLVYGRTNNPHDLDRTPGGSSGGEAALAAADAIPLGLGTDGLGSIRVPAHYCGVLGLRPTAGRVPETGNWPSTRASGYMDFYCVGPIARSAQDALLALETIAGPDGTDPYAVAAPLGDPDDVAVEGLRVGVFTGSEQVPSTPETVSTIEDAAQALEAAGAEVDGVAVPWSPNPTDLGFAAMVADGGAQMRADVAPAEGRHHPAFQQFLDSAATMSVTAAEWFRLQGEIYQLRRRVRALFQSFHLLVGPVVTGPAPLHGRPPSGVAEEEYGDYHAFDAVHLFALAGVPAASVPAGWQAGLPLGVQVAGAPFREDVVLKAADVIMARSGARPPAPPAGDDRGKGLLQ